MLRTIAACVLSGCITAMAGNTDGRSRTDVVNAYSSQYLASALTIADIAWTGSVSECDPGTIAPIVYERTLQRINYFRALVGLPTSVVYEESRNEKCQQAALMCLANRSLNHSPPATWTCYTADGAAGCGNSNLSTASAAGAITNQMTDAGANNTAAGHRRWILYSRARTFGIGSGSSYCALWVLGNGSNPIPADMPDFIAYPPAGFMPAPITFPRWSFGIPRADFRNATVSMSGPSGAVALTVEPLSHNTYGDNAVVWVPSGISTTAAEDRTYTVTISNVLDAPHTSYTYTVTLIAPGTAGVARAHAPQAGRVPAAGARCVLRGSGVIVVGRGKDPGDQFDTRGRMLVRGRTGSVN